MLGRSRFLVGGLNSMSRTAIGLNRKSLLVSGLKQNKMLYSQGSDKKTSEPKKILDDDLLAKAGFEDVGEKGNPEGATEEGKSSEKRSSRRNRKLSSKDKKREKYANWFYISTFVGAVVGGGYLSRDWDSEEEQKKLEGENIPNGYALSAVWERLNKRLGSLFTFFSDPVFEKLLPPPAPEAYLRPLTLVLTLDDLLIHSSWDTKNGWRTAKRPGLDYFLGYLSAYYEIVIFSSNYMMFSEKVVGKLDPYHAYISYALYREGCRYKDGKLIKDLSLLNRDLGKTVIIDVDEESVSMQPENAIRLQPWDGNPDDTLVKLIPFLEYLATQPVKDVRPILNSFKDKTNIIEEFAEREKQLRAQWREENKHLLANAHRPNAGTFLASLLGLPASSLNKEPKMPLDIIRENGQLQYQSFLRLLEENAPKILEEEQKLKQEFGKTSINKLLTEGAPSPEDIAKLQAERAAQESAAQEAARK